MFNKTRHYGKVKLGWWGKSPDFVVSKWSDVCSINKQWFMGSIIVQQSNTTCKSFWSCWKCCKVSARYVLLTQCRFFTCCTLTIVTVVCIGMYCSVRSAVTSIATRTGTVLHARLNRLHLSERTLQLVKKRFWHPRLIFTRKFPLHPQRRECRITAQMNLARPEIFIIKQMTWERLFWDNIITVQTLFCCIASGLQRKERTNEGIADSCCCENQCVKQFL